MNSLTFFVKLTLEEALDLHELLNNTSPNEHGREQLHDETTSLPCEIILDKGTSCGLYDPWNGAGSALDIVLEKDVVLPIKYIDSTMPDGCRGYSVENIYGMLRSFWSDGGLKIGIQGGNAV